MVIRDQRNMKDHIRLLRYLIFILKDQVAEVVETEDKPKMFIKGLEHLKDHILQRQCLTSMLEDQAEDSVKTVDKAVTKNQQTLSYHTFHRQKLQVVLQYPVHLANIQLHPP